MSVCTGAYALAGAGLLDGRRAATHWAWAEELAARFPAVTVEPGVLFVDEGEVLTSAGLSAGIDLSLHVIRRDHGVACADRVARHMVAPPHRDGGQAQFFSAAEPARGAGRPIRLARADPRLGCRTPRGAARRRDMARHANVSPRTFARRFRAEAGTTPLQWLLGRRVLAARRLLEESDLPVEEIAREVGIRRRRLAALPLPPRHRDHADRLPALERLPSRLEPRVGRVQSPASAAYRTLSAVFKFATLPTPLRRLLAAALLVLALGGGIYLLTSQGATTPASAATSPTPRSRRRARASSASCRRRR